MSDKRAVCLNCLDGRVQLPVAEWIKQHRGFDFVDMVTEPGMDGILADAGRDIAKIEDKIKISIAANDAKEIFVVGHFDCRGNPVTEAKHHEQVQASVARVRDDFPAFPVIGLWVDNNWDVHCIEGP